MKKRDIIFTCVVLLLMVFTIGISFAYFGLQIDGNDTSKVIESVSSGLSLTFTDSDIITMNNVYPGDTITKTISVQNTGTKNLYFNFEWVELNNEFENFDLRISANCTSYYNGVERDLCYPIEERAISDGYIDKNIGIKPGYTHKYDIVITFKNRSFDQSYNMNKTFSGKIGISEYSVPKPVYANGTKPVNNCIFDGELVQGAEYVNGQYTYVYMKKYNGSTWNTVTEDGWGVKLTDLSSSDPVTSALCTTINDKPIIYMNSMFYDSMATSIDLSSFDTSNVISMYQMFYNSRATELDLGNFDTSKVTNMAEMFANSRATSIDLSSFDTSNVTSMYAMFYNSLVTELDLSEFDTWKVTNMMNMFYGSRATKINLSSFETAGVTNMNSMFRVTAVDSLDLSNFDFQSVEDMGYMFCASQAKSIDLFGSSMFMGSVTNMSGMFKVASVTHLDLSGLLTGEVTNMYEMFSSSAITHLDLNWRMASGYDANMDRMFYGTQMKELDLTCLDTSNVISMNEMFAGSTVEKLDLRSFDTSNVTDMNYMFSRSQATTLNLSSFDTSNVTTMRYMFSDSKATSLDLSSFDTSNVTDMSDMFYSSEATIGYARTQDDADRLNATSNKPSGLTFVVK